MSKFIVTLGTNQRDRLYSRPAATRREALEVVAPQILEEAIAREVQRSWFIGETVFIRIEQDDG
jgi:hypothetical protein